MRNVAIIVSKSKGGLRAVAEEAGMKVIEGTEVEFDTLATFSDPLSTSAGYIDTSQRGWIAFAV